MRGAEVATYFFVGSQPTCTNSNLAILPRVEVSHAPHNSREGKPDSPIVGTSSTFSAGSQESSPSERTRSEGKHAPVSGLLSEAEGSTTSASPLPPHIIGVAPHAPTYPRDMLGSHDHVTLALLLLPSHGVVVVEVVVERVRRLQGTHLRHDHVPSRPATPQNNGGRSSSDTAQQTRDFGLFAHRPHLRRISMPQAQTPGA